MANGPDLAGFPDAGWPAALAKAFADPIRAQRPLGNLQATVLRAYPMEGPAWLELLPPTIEACTARWNLTELTPFQNLTYNFVAAAEQNGAPVVLKIGSSVEGSENEAAAMRAFGGVCSARVLAEMPEHSAMLLERLTPGIPLESTWTPESDERQTLEIAQTMIGLWKEPPGGPIPPLASWLQVFDEVPSEPILETAKGDWRDLKDAAEPQVLLHGDLHHGNVLTSSRGCKAIDPQGVVGPRAFEIYALLRNPVQATPEEILSLCDSRLGIVSEVTGIECQVLAHWGFLGVAMGHCWDIQEGTAGEDATLRLAERLAEIARIA